MLQFTVASTEKPAAATVLQSRLEVLLGRRSRRTRTTGRGTVLQDSGIQFVELRPRPESSSALATSSLRYPTALLQQPRCRLRPRRYSETLASGRPPATAPDCFQKPLNHRANIACAQCAPKRCPPPGWVFPGASPQPCNHRV